MQWMMPGMAALFAALILVYFLVQRRRRWLLAAQSLSANLAACETLLNLIASLQQHRGMSSAWLSGDAGFKRRLEEKARQIDELLPRLRELAQRESLQAHPCLTLNELQLFRFRWEKLRDGLASHTPEQSIARHSELLEKPLSWLAALGEARVEPLFPEADLQRLARNYASRLPALSECLGQARAVGAGVAAQGRCSPVARVRLVFLISRAESLLQAALAGDGGGRAESASQAVQRMLLRIREGLLAGPVELAPEQYFALATRAIDLVFSWMDGSGERLLHAGQSWLDAHQDVPVLNP